MDAAPCCSPGRAAPDRPAPAGRRRTAGATGTHPIEQAAVPAQVFAMGDTHGDGEWADGETPRHEVSVSAFTIDATTVTNAAFAEFVAATGHRTEAEEFGFSAVFHLALAADEADVVGRPPQTPWWVGVAGADWRHPGGRRSDLDGLADHPVTHVSWNDAVAYCDWAARALPTEAQWECASRGGLAGLRYPWGDELSAADDGPGWPCNIWQGEFPLTNLASDGHVTTAPVRAYAPNAYGLFQTVGNVWEWCADWFSPTAYATSTGPDPRGPRAGVGRVMRGGSYLCHDSYCNRYRNAARTSNTPDSSAGNVGFRTVSR